MLKKSLIIMTILLAVGASRVCGSSVLLDRIVAVVNKEAITWTELYRAMEFEMSNLTRGLTEEEKRDIFKKNEAGFLETMVDMKLQLQEARKLGISASEEEVDRAIESIRDKYSMDEETFKQAVREEGFTPGKYREMIHEQIVIGRLVEREVRSKLKTPGMAGRDDDILYSVSQIFFSLDEGEDTAAVDKKITAVMDGLAAGEDFGELAMKYSEGPAANVNGDLGVIPKSQMADEFAKALESLRPGEVSKPFRTGQGVYILKLKARKDEKEALRDKLFMKQYKAWLRGLRDKSFIEIRLD